jgi:hypothetical protein
MTKLEIIALCEFADYSQNKAFNITGIFDQVKSKSLPTSLNAFVAFTITGLNPKTGFVVNLMISHKGDKILDENLDLVVGSNGKANYKYQIVGLPLKEIGFYEVSVLDGKKKLGDTTFEVL